jgi:hypothetical protein
MLQDGIEYRRNWASWYPKERSDPSIDERIYQPRRCWAHR